MRHLILEEAKQLQNQLVSWIRTFDKKVSSLLIQRLNEIVPAVASAYRVSCEIEELSNVPSLVIAFMIFLSLNLS